MLNYLFLLFILFSTHAFAQAQSDPVLCSYPNINDYDSNIGPTHLVPFMKLERQGSHVKVTVLETQWQEEISENLYPYFIPREYINEGLFIYQSHINFDTWQDPLLDEEGYPVERPGRLGFGLQPGHLIPISDSYNQSLYIWGEYNIVNFSFDSTGEDYIGLHYFSPINESGDRLVGDTYYCKERELNQLFWGMDAEGLITKFDTPDGLENLDYEYNPVGFGFEILNYTQGVFCSRDTFSYSFDDYYYEEGALQEVVNLCSRAQWNLLWVLKFMENHNYSYNFDFEKLRQTVIYFDDSGYSNEASWQTDNHSGQEYLQMDAKASKREILMSLKRFIDEDETGIWFEW